MQTPITTTDQLSKFCRNAALHPYVTVDTEFMREKTYFSQLCLVQVATTEDAALIDPLAKGIDLSPLFELLANSDVTKVFHAARQDVEIFYRLMNVVPAPLYDTQVAAMAAGHGDQVGYEPLVRAITGAQVDKGSRFTDWSKRPLSSKQLTYALGDVTHLIDVYTELVSQLKAAQRDHWVEEEMAALLEPSLYFVAPEQAWRRLKLRNVKPKELAVIMKVAEWREHEAQRKDLPRSRILKDDAIIELSRARPTSAADLGALRAIPGGFERSKHCEPLLSAISNAAEMDPEDLPKLNDPRHKIKPPADVLDLLRVLLKRQSELHDVAPKLLASASDLEQIALSDSADVPALKGWRREVFGDYAIRLKNGKIAMALSNGTVELIER